MNSATPAKSVITDTLQTEDSASKYSYPSFISAAENISNLYTSFILQTSFSDNLILFFPN